nr:MAG TPA: portal protein [Caudoviricetes sp.]
MMMILGNGFAHFFTVLLNNKFGNRKLSFTLLVLPVSYYNSFEYTSKAKDLAAFGYSFLTPILSTGLNQTSLADLKVLENEVLNLDVILKPLQSAYTQSGKTNAITA